MAWRGLWQSCFWEWLRKHVCPFMPVPGASAMVSGSMSAADRKCSTILAGKVIAVCAYKDLWLVQLTSKFLQSTHLHMSEHRMLAWKHSQYFFRQPLFLQLQPLLWRTRLPVMGSCTKSCTQPNLSWVRIFNLICGRTLVNQTG